MTRTQIETVVGVFVLIGMLCLGYLSIRLGKMEIVGGDYYRVSADFTSVSGLKEGASVEIAGVIVGRVSGIALDPDEGSQARVSMQIRSGVKVTDDVIASIRTRGIIGDKYIKLMPGGSENHLANGAVILSTESAIDFEEIVSEFIQGRI